MACTVWNKHHRTRLACRRPGPGAHRDIERGKVPSAARVACIARSASLSLSAVSWGYRVEMLFFRYLTVM